MATSDGMTQVVWIPGDLEDPENPTIDEIGDGEPLADFIASDGLDMGYDQATYDDSVLSGTWATEDGGKKTVAPEITFVSNLSDDDIWDLFATPVIGYLVVRRNVASNAEFEEGQVVEVVRAIAGVRKPAPTAENEPTKFTVNFLCRGEAVVDGAVAPNPEE